MIKFGLAYSLRVTTTGTDLTIKMPFTVDFDVERSSYSSVNYARIRVYNLSKNHRNQILHDQYDTSPFNIMHVTLQAGYGAGPQWPVVFDGNATRAYSIRQGTDFITVIEAFDGGDAYANAVSTVVAPQGTAQKDILNALLNDLVPYGVKIGAIADFEGTASRGQSYSGNTINLLRDLTNGNFFIDNLRVNVLFPGDTIAGNILTISPESGLLGTPVKETQFLLLDMLFEPRVAIGTQILLKASTAETYNGYHEIVSIHHKGTISAAVSGEALTSLGLRSGVFDTVVSQAGL